MCRRLIFREAMVKIACQQGYSPPQLLRESKITSKCHLHSKATLQNRSRCHPWNCDRSDNLRKIRSSGAIFWTL
jgi:hypothetical protein